MSPDFENTRDIEQRFALKLIASTCNNADYWEDNEISMLVLLLIDELDLRNDNKQLIRFLSEIEHLTPTILTSLLDNHIGLTSQQIISLLTFHETTTTRIIQIIDETLENRILNLKDSSVIETLYSLYENSMTHDDLIQYTTMICNHCGTKKTCGKILSVFTTHFSFMDAAVFIKEVISHGSLYSITIYVHITHYFNYHYRFL
jgi:hypothetical protein